MPGSPEGTPCGVDRPDGSTGVCIDGLTCGPVADGKNVCTRDCNQSSDCAGWKCFQQVGREAKGYCAQGVAMGQACDTGALKQCMGIAPGEIVGCIPGADGGLCFDRCNSTTPCPSGQACTEAFSDGNGACVRPTQPGDACDQPGLQFCAQGQLCVVGSSGGAGVCHLACDPADAGCPGGGACVLPDPCASSAAICAAPRGDGESCDPTSDAFCGPGLDCTNLSGQLTCKPDCSAGQACPSGTACHPLPAPDGRTSCQSACF